MFNAMISLSSVIIIRFVKDRIKIVIIEVHEGK